MLVGTGTQAPV